MGDCVRTGDTEAWGIGADTVLPENGFDKEGNRTGDEVFAIADGGAQLLSAVVTKVLSRPVTSDPKL